MRMYRVADGFCEQQLAEPFGKYPTIGHVVVVRVVLLFLTPFLLPPHPRVITGYSHYGHSPLCVQVLQSRMDQSHRWMSWRNIMLLQLHF